MDSGAPKVKARKSINKHQTDLRESATHIASNSLYDQTPVFKFENNSTNKEASELNEYENESSASLFIKVPIRPRSNYNQISNHSSSSNFNKSQESARDFTFSSYKLDKSPISIRRTVNPESNLGKLTQNDNSSENSDDNMLLALKKHRSSRKNIDSLNASKIDLSKSRYDDENHENSDESKSHSVTSDILLRGIFALDERSVDLELHNNFIKWKAVSGIKSFILIFFKLIIIIIIIITIIIQLWLKKNPNYK